MTDQGAASNYVTGWPSAGTGLAAPAPTRTRGQKARPVTAALQSTFAKHLGAHPVGLAELRSPAQMAREPVDRCPVGGTWRNASREPRWINLSS
jgi:hypothetical protein